MIAQVQGALTATDGDLITVMTAAGVAYELSLPVGAVSRLPPVGSDLHVHTVLVVREDAWSLFGFDLPAERGVFQRLLQANGVGPRLALAMISALGGDRHACARGHSRPKARDPGGGKLPLRRWRRQSQHALY